MVRSYYPLPVAELKKKKIINEKGFYNRVSERANYIDPKTIKMVHRALLETTAEDIRIHGVGIIPEVGFLYIKKDRAHGGVPGVMKRHFAPMPVLKFKINTAFRMKLNKYIRNHTKIFG